MGVKAVQVIDPVFLCQKEHYKKLIDSAKCSVGGDYICTYFIHPNSTKYGMEKICEELNLGHINTINADEDMLSKDRFNKAKWPYTLEDNLTVESWLKYLTNSNLIITDSFHATSLAIIYNIPFVFIKGSLNVLVGMDRLGTLLGIAGLENRVVTTVEEAFEKKTYNQPIDWEQVNARMKPEIERSRQWLENSLKAEII